MSRKIASVLVGAAVVGTVFAVPGVASAAIPPRGRVSERPDLCFGRRSRRIRAPLGWLLRPVAQHIS